MLKPIARLFTCLLIAGSAALAQAQTATISGSLPRDMSTGELYLTVTVSNVPDADHQRGINDPADEEANLAERLQIYLTSISNTKPIYHTPPQAAQDPSLPFSSFPAQAHTETQQADGTWTYTYYPLISEAIPGALAQKTCNGSTCSVAVTVDFYLGGTDGTPVADVNPPVILQQDAGPTVTCSFEAAGDRDLKEVDLMINPTSSATGTQLGTFAGVQVFAKLYRCAGQPRGFVAVELDGKLPDGRYQLLASTGLGQSEVGGSSLTIGFLGTPTKLWLWCPYNP